MVVRHRGRGPAARPGRSGEGRPRFTGVRPFSKDYVDGAAGGGRSPVREPVPVRCALACPTAAGPRVSRRLDLAARPRSSARAGGRTYRSLSAPLPSRVMPARDGASECGFTVRLIAATSSSEAGGGGGSRLTTASFSTASTACGSMRLASANSRSAVSLSPSDWRAPPSRPVPARWRTARLRRPCCSRASSAPDSPGDLAHAVKRPGRAWTESYQSSDISGRRTCP